MAGNLLLWLISSAMLLAYFWFVTLRKPFKTVSRHFLILLGVHVALSIAAIQLKNQVIFCRMNIAPRGCGLSKAIWRSLWC